MASFSETKTPGSFQRSVQLLLDPDEAFEDSVRKAMDEIQRAARAESQ
jgi:hypothetical protein